jgi:hypothetical protein
MRVGVSKLKVMPLSSLPWCPFPASSSPWQDWFSFFHIATSYLNIYGLYFSTRFVEGELHMLIMVVLRWGSEVLLLQPSSSLRKDMKGCNTSSTLFSCSHLLIYGSFLLIWNLHNAGKHKKLGFSGILANC